MQRNLDWKYLAEKVHGAKAVQVERPIFPLATPLGQRYDTCDHPSRVSHEMPARFGKVESDALSDTDVTFVSEHGAIVESHGAFDSIRVQYAHGPKDSHRTDIRKWYLTAITETSSARLIP